MIKLLNIRDTTLASPGKAVNTLTVAVSGEAITVRELICHRVRQEVEEFNKQRPETFTMLIKPSQAESTLNGFKLQPGRRIDEKEQIKKALEAFESNGFVILVGDRQAEDLDQTIILQPENEITFLKLVPLVGG